MASEATKVFTLMPDKGYKGFKAAVTAAHAYCLMKLNQLGEARTSMMQAMKYCRESGEKEAELYRTLEAALLNALDGHRERACLLLGASESYSESSGYPLVGTSEVQRNEIREIIPTDHREGKKWYEEGRKMKIEKAVVYTMADD